MVGDEGVDVVEIVEEVIDLNKYVDKVCDVGVGVIFIFLGMMWDMFEDKWVVEFWYEVYYVMVLE